MKRNKLFCALSVILMLVFQACSPKLPAASEFLEIRNVLQKQSDCWSKGDLECYMQGYWKSDSLLFVGSRGLTYGWNKTLENYRKSYPDTNAMGKLTFQILEEKPLEKDVVLVVGKWHLNRNTATDLEGHFSIIFQKIDQKWLIVADHSS